MENEAISLKTFSIMHPLLKKHEADFKVAFLIQIFLINEKKQSNDN
jgi:hypothetical protein